MPLAVPVFGLPPSGQTHVSAAASKAETLESESKTQSARKVARAAVAPPAPEAAAAAPPGLVIAPATRTGPGHLAPRAHDTDRTQTGIRGGPGLGPPTAA